MKNKNRIYSISLCVGLIIFSTVIVKSQDPTESQLKNMMGDANYNYFDVTQFADQYFSNHPDLIADDEGGFYNEYIQWKAYWEKRYGYFRNYIINPNQSNKNIDLSGYTPGSYFIRLVCDGFIKDEKTLIIIQ